MRPIIMVVVAALAVALVLELRAKVVTAEAPQQARSTTVPVFINIMEMMRRAKDLPIQQFDAI